jgi:antitoxin VapB
MGISIKNPEVERLAKEFAAKTGKGQTEAIGFALREALERLNEAARQRNVYDKLMAISEKTAPLMRDFDWDEVLYGENGLYDRETGLPK